MVVRESVQKALNLERRSQPLYQSPFLGREAQWSHSR